MHESVQQRPSQQAPGPHGKTPDTQVALNLPDGSFSKQHQGIPGTSDAAMFDDNNLLDDAVAAMDGEMHIADAPVTTLGSLHASSSQVGDLAIMPDPPQPRPLCSQEEKLQHVSYSPMTSKECSATVHNALVSVLQGLATYRGIHLQCFKMVPMMMDMMKCIAAKQAYVQFALEPLLIQYKVHVLQVILPAVRKFLKPSKQRATDGSVVELTQLEKLYKIFERC